MHTLFDELYSWISGYDGEQFRDMEHDQLDLHRMQAALKKKRNPYISPISMLPSELLAHIFKSATASVSDRKRSPECVKRDLSRVCFRWRQVALEVCPVWRDFCLTVNLSNALEDKR